MIYVYPPFSRAGDHCASAMVVGFMSFLNRAWEGSWYEPLLLCSTVLKYYTCWTTCERVLLTQHPF